MRFFFRKKSIDKYAKAAVDEAIKKFDDVYGSGYWDAFNSVAAAKWNLRHLLCEYITDDVVRDAFNSVFDDVYGSGYWSVESQFKPKLKAQFIKSLVEEINKYQVAK